MYLPQVICDDFFPENFITSLLSDLLFFPNIYIYIWLQKEELHDRLLGYLNGKMLACVDRLPKQNSESL